MGPKFLGGNPSRCVLCKMGQGERVLAHRERTSKQNILLHPSCDTCLPLKRNYSLDPQVFFKVAVAPIISCSREPWASGASALPLPPAVVGQGSVGLRHLVHVMLPLDHRALVVKSLQQLV